LADLAPETAQFIALRRRQLVSARDELVRKGRTPEKLARQLEPSA
jgi:hypothetical protein